LLFPANRLSDRAKHSQWERGGGRARERFALMIALNAGKLIFALGLLDRPKTPEEMGISFGQFLHVAASRRHLGDKFEAARYWQAPVTAFPATETLRSGSSAPVLLVADLLHPVDRLAVEPFLDGDAAHRRGRRRAGRGFRSVIPVTPSYGGLCFNAPVRWTAAGEGGGFGDAAMSRNLGSPNLYDESLIDDRNERPLAIAFATIVLVWMLAFGIVSVSAHIGVQSHHMAESAALIEK
jgi:hypothetical protein